MRKTIGLVCSTLLILTVLFVASCATPVKDLYPPAADPALQRMVYIVDHGWHTGLIVQRKEAIEYLPALRNHFNQAGYLEIGWGDESFYRASEVDLALAIRALFTSSGTVLHVVAFSSPPKHYFHNSTVLAIPLSADGYRRLLESIQASFVIGYEQPVALGKGLYGDSAFFRAQGRYSVLNTCNKWTAQQLREAGFPITPLYALTAGNVLWQVKRGLGD